MSSAACERTSAENEPPAQAGELKLVRGGGRSARAEAVLRAAQRASVPPPNIHACVQRASLHKKQRVGRRRFLPSILSKAQRNPLDIARVRVTSPQLQSADNIAPSVSDAETSVTTEGGVTSQQLAILAVASEPTASAARTHLSVCVTASQSVSSQQYWSPVVIFKLIYQS